MTYKDNIMAILECSFAGFKEEIIESACNRILEQEKPETVTEFADRCRECGAKYGKLLKQEPCEDAISRQAVLEYIEGSEAELGHSSENELVCQDIKELPPVNPEPKTGCWIPVSEKLPEENKTVIVSTTYGVYPEAKYSKEYGWEWAYESGADYWKELEGVTAWMPLPKPYGPQESEEV